MTCYGIMLKNVIHCKTHYDHDTIIIIRVPLSQFGIILIKILICIMEVIQTFLNIETIKTMFLLTK